MPASGALRSCLTIVAAAAALALPGCGIKGPLRLPPATPATATTPAPAPAPDAASPPPATPDAARSPRP
ncbi:MAG: sugar transporter [Betaproteobacteria bacterium]|nr:sugar transporter [Betaproteobacteria bacterium]